MSCNVLGGGWTWWVALTKTLTTPYKISGSIGGRGTMTHASFGWRERLESTHEPPGRGAVTNATFGWRERLESIHEPLILSPKPCLQEEEPT